MSGLIVGSSLTLSNSNGDNLSVSADGNFTFPVKLVSGGSVAVTVTTPLVAQNCSVEAGSSSNISANITNVAVTCTAAQQYACVLNNGLNSISYFEIDNLTDQNVSQYLIQSDDTLKPNTPATAPVGCRPNGFAIDPAGKYAYIVCVTDQSVSQYTSDANGGLTKTSAAAVSTGVHPWDISVTPDDRFVYVTDHGNPNAGGGRILKRVVALVGGNGGR